MTAKEYNSWIRTEGVVLGIYHQDGAWRTGRLQRVRRRGIVWQAQPWGTQAWRELKSGRQVWVDRREEDAAPPAPAV